MEEHDQTIVPSFGPGKDPTILCPHKGRQFSETPVSVLLPQEAQSQIVQGALKRS